MGKNNRQSGYTLVEVVIALTLTGVVAAVFATTFQQIVYTHRLLAGRVSALVIGQAKMAELESGSEPSSSGDFPKPYQNFYWLAQEETADDDTKIILLTVEWKDDSSKHQISFKGFRDPE